MGPGGPPPGDFGGDGPGGMPPGDAGPDPLFGEGGPAGGPPPGDMPPPGDFGGDGPGGMPPGDMGPGGPGDMPPPDGMGDMHTHMDDAGGPMLQKDLLQWRSWTSARGQQICLHLQMIQMMAVR